MPLLVLGVRQDDGAQLLAQSGAVSIRLPRLAERERRFSPSLGRWFEVEYEVTAGSDIVIEDPQVEVQLQEAVAQRAQLLANGATHAAGQDVDPLPVVRLLALDAHAT
jgi:hypothetical protein